MNQVIGAKLHGQIYSAEAVAELPKMDLVDALMASINAEKDKATQPEGSLASRIGEMTKTEAG
ncbi:unnamed protein product [marine sediment metagenome]|uniref:Uncharacterized protein n=1 Tax=marine sediment metagenome TaxID=412755 RepID=X0X496_9ZZZZ